MLYGWDGHGFQTDSSWFDVITFSKQSDFKNS